MMSYPMCLQVTCLSKLIVANITFEWLLIQMNISVILQGRAALKTFIASVTAESVRVLECVLNKLSFRFKFKVTLVALKLGGTILRIFNLHYTNIILSVLMLSIFVSPQIPLTPEYFRA